MNAANFDRCGIRFRRGACVLRTIALLVLAASILPGCASLQPAAPPPAPVDCEEQEQEVSRLRQALAEQDAEVQRLRAQQNVQAQELQQTTVEAVRAEVKLRRLATEAGAASQLAEVEVALQQVRRIRPGQAAAQLLSAQRILEAGGAAFAQGDFGAAVELAAQAQEIIDMVANGHRMQTTARSNGEAQFQVPVVLRTRVDSNLRARPARTAAVLDVLRQGTTLQAYGYRGDWLRVRAADGRDGWVFGPLLEAPARD